MIRLDLQGFQFAESVEGVFGYGLNSVVGQEQVMQMNLMLESVVGQIRDSVVAEISARHRNEICKERRST